MKTTGIRRILSAVLAIVLLAGAMPIQAAQRSENRFVLSAEAGGQLVIAPEYVTYEEGQNIAEALDGSRHTFSGLQDGQVYAINGVAGNYTRSDQTGSYALDTPATSVTHYRFSENIGTSRPSCALQALMTAMADYLLEPSDVQAAARTEYENACAEFVGVSDERAALLTAALLDRIETYQFTQDFEGTVTFTDGERTYAAAAYEGIVIRMESTYGKQVTDEDGDGMITAPIGEYTYTISYGSDHIQGKVTVAMSGSTVSAAFPEEIWLDLDAFRISEEYGAAFDSGVFHASDAENAAAWEGRTLQVLVPDAFSGTLYTYAEYTTANTPAFTALYTDSRGSEREKTLAFASRQVGPDRVLSRGAEGNVVVYRLAAEIDDYTVFQDYTVSFCRIPTLTGIKLEYESNGNRVDIAATEPFSAATTEYVYKVTDSVASVFVTPTALVPSYDITVNGQPLCEGGVEIDLSETTSITVQVSGGGYSTDYTLEIRPGQGKQITFKTTAKDVTLEVTNSNGLVIPFTRFKDSSGFNQYQYTLVPGEEYFYVATRDEFFHATNSFTLDELAGSVTEVSVPVEHWLTDLAFGTESAGGSKGTLPLAFSPDNHTYQLTVEDSESNVYAWVTATDKNLGIAAQYVQLSHSSSFHGKDNTTVLTSGYSSGVKMNQLLVQNNPYGNSLTIRLEKTVNGITYYQDYCVDITRNLSLQYLSAFCGGQSVLLYQDEALWGYTPEVRSYELTVPMAADTLELLVDSYIRDAMNVCYGEEDTGYGACIRIGDGDWEEVPESGEVSLPLSGGLETETVLIEVVNDKTPDSSLYILAVKKAAPTVVDLTVDPQDALVCVHERSSGNRIWPEEGTLLLSEGFIYDYTATKNGFVGTVGTLQVTRDGDNALVLLHNGEMIPVTEANGAGSAELILTLPEVPENDQINAELPAQWPDFRGGSDNNGITDAPIPYNANEGTLYWAIKLGNGIDSGAVGSPIIVDGDLITYAGDMIYRIDSISGEILAKGKMDHRSSFSITPPVYYEGMVFVALSDGSVQAFNAETLESLWLYSDPLGGQPNSPIAVCNGYLYTGFWNSENVEANFVCLSVADEDPTQQKEEKVASWYYTQMGGFYWAGAYVCEDFLLVGTDDGDAGYVSASSRLLLFDTASGRLLDSWEQLNGDVRSTVSYDSGTDAYYFVSKGGTFYSVKVAQANGQWKLLEKRYVTLSNSKGGVPMSTSTPVVYNGRAYIGVAGAGQFSAYSGHNITVIDLQAMRKAYSVPTMGYPQTSGLLTTAYEESGYVYVYFVDNYTPGKIRVLRDKAGQTSGSYYTADGSHLLAYDLFSPVDAQAEYAICSPIVDEYGTMYFKNDSGYLMAYGSTVDRIDVTAQPERTVYASGETFDPSGMEVTATLKNGMTRDVTDYVTWSEDALSAEDSEITLVFPHVMYRNQENGNAMDIGVAATRPNTTVEVSIAAAGPATEIRRVMTEVGKVSVVFDGTANPAWQIFAAVYSGGKMLCIQEIPAGERVTLSAAMTIPVGATDLKIFVLDADGAPVMDFGEKKLA